MKGIFGSSLNCWVHLATPKKVHSSKVDWAHLIASFCFRGFARVYISFLQNIQTPTQIFGALVQWPKQVCFVCVVLSNYFHRLKFNSLHIKVTFDWVEKNEIKINWNKFFKLKWNVKNVNHLIFLFFFPFFSLSFLTQRNGA